MNAVPSGNDDLPQAPSAASPAPKPKPLPPLRQDLALLPAAENPDGSPAWMIHDPVCNRFYRIGWLEFEMLLRWQASAEKLLAEVRNETPLAPDMDTLNALVTFLERNFLLRPDSAQASDRLLAIAQRQKRRDWRWLAHNYLFFRVPLVRPERFLSAVLPWIGWIYTRGFAIAIAAAALLGLALVGQQWDTFMVSMHDSFTPAGIFAWLVALAVTKMLHELAHAFTATRYGVRVAHMGVSFIVLFPLLYTDTSESWKLIDRRKRLAIVAAGLTAELCVAALATLAWSLTSDGAVRSALFFLATTSWVLSVGINASPFMRFDGYFILSDLLDFPNLHARSFAFARAFLRRHLLGWDEPDPEVVSQRFRRGLIAFAFLTWLYRLALFFGIALVVYHFFFKALGIVLFLLEIGWFIALPIWSELKVWWSRRAETPGSRRRWLLAIPLVLLVFPFVPLPYGVSAPAWIRPERSIPLHAPFPALAIQVHGGGEVEAGSVLIALDSPDIRARVASADAVTATLRSQLNRSGTTVSDAERQRLLASQLLQGIAEWRSAQEEAERLVLVAPFPGLLVDLDPLVQPGVWVNPQQRLGIILDPRSWIADAYVEQGDLPRLQVGDKARVYVSDRLTPIPATVIAIDSTRTQYLPDPILSVDHGGPIVSVTGSGEAEIKDSLYRVRLQLAKPPPSMRTQIAHVHVRGEARAPAVDWLRHVASIAIRESGF